MLINIGTNQFYNTPLGEATREAITQAVEKIVARGGQVQWSSLVVDYDGQDVYVNAGQNARLNVGDRFVVQRIVKTFTDPSTGEVLGTRKAELGVVTLSGVDPKMSYGSYMPLQQAPPQRGDLVMQLEQ